MSSYTKLAGMVLLALSVTVCVIARGDEGQKKSPFSGLGGHLLNNGNSQATADSQPASQPATQPQPATEPTTQPQAASTEPATQPIPPPPVHPRRDDDALPRISAHSTLQPRGLAAVNVTADQVNQMIERGRDFLWAHLRQQLAKEHRRLGESDQGYDSLQALALVHAGAQLKYPEFDAELRGFLSRIDPQHQPLGTYEAGIVCMLIGDYADPIYLPKMRLITRSLIEQQTLDGSWDYGHPIPDNVFAELQSARALSVEGGIPLDQPNFAAPPMQRILPPGKDKPGDDSTSQFALLGLRAASRVQINSDPQVWARALNAYRQRRCADGGWGYDVGSISGYGSMTCAGICSMTIARFELGEKDAPADADIERGLAWLDKNFSVSSNPQHGGYLYYYLYSLERVGRILDTEFIGSHEWYPLGVQFLLGAQRKDGSWLELPDDDPRTPTSFALLFLTRATQSLQVELKHGGNGQVTTAVATPPPARLYVILDASGSMLDEMDGKQKFDVARGAVSTMLAGMPDSAEVALRVYGHRKRSLERDSDLDTALEYPMAKIDRPKLAALLARLRPRGKTPLALSLLQAKQDLAALNGQPVTVVLLTDGGEDTMPRRDPVKAAADFGKIKGVTFHIVGFDINQEDWGIQLRAMAEKSGGQYWPAARAGILERELRSAVFGIPDDFTLFDSSRKEVAKGQFGQSTSVPEGKYLFSTSYGGHEYDSELWVNTGASTAVVFNANQAKASGTNAAPSVSQQVAHRFCTHCGAALPPGAKFCPKCGTKVQN